MTQETPPSTPTYVPSRLTAEELRARKRERERTPAYQARKRARAATPQQREQARVRQSASHNQEQARARAATPQHREQARERQSTAPNQEQARARAATAPNQEQARARATAQRNSGYGALYMHARTFDVASYDEAEHRLPKTGQPDSSGLPTSYMDIGAATHICAQCGSLMFAGEQIPNNPHFNICCQNGAVQLDEHLGVPSPLKGLLQDDTTFAKDFRKHARAYNNSLAMASINITSERFMEGWNPSISIQGQMYHTVGPLRPSANQQNPFTLQAYFMEANPDAEVEHRLQWAYGSNNLNPVTLRYVSIHHYCNSYRIRQTDRCAAFSGIHCPPSILDPGNANERCCTCSALQDAPINVA